MRSERKHRQRKGRPRAASRPGGFGGSSPRAGTAQTGWHVGYGIGAATVAAVVALVSAILAYARSIGDEAPDINSALRAAERNTAPLGALRTTIDDANAIVSGLQRGRTRLGG